MLGGRGGRSRLAWRPGHGGHCGGRCQRAPPAPGPGEFPGGRFAAMLTRCMRGPCPPPPPAPAPPASRTRGLAPPAWPTRLTQCLRLGAGSPGGSPAASPPSWLPLHLSSSGLRQRPHPRSPPPGTYPELSRTCHPSASSVSPSLPALSSARRAWSPCGNETRPVTRARSLRICLGPRTPPTPGCSVGRGLGPAFSKI